VTTWINVKLLDPKCKPERKTAGAVGYDLVAREGVEILAGRVGKVPVGVCLEMAPGTEAQVRPRSGLTLRGLIGVLGTIDSDYRGEIGVLLHNTTGEHATVRANKPPAPALEVPLPKKRAASLSDRLRPVRA